MSNVNYILDNAFDIYVLKIDIHMLFFQLR
jgi:hypothetical protein